MDSVRLSLHAMATRFELVMHGDDPIRLRAAGEEALREIERVEAQLSFYHPESELTWINRHAGHSPVQTDPRLFRLLQSCMALTRATDGAFDITVGPLMRAWRFVSDKGGIPADAELDAARAVTGIDRLTLDQDRLTVGFDLPGVELDFGGYGKGYAIERAVELLKEHGVASALLHGGASSVFTIGSPPQIDEGWAIELQEPLKGPVVYLKDNALSVSAVHGKSFKVDGREYGHVIDPRTGRPVNAARAAAAIGPSAAVCEALSKALLVLGQNWLPQLSARFPEYQGYLGE